MKTPLTASSPTDCQDQPLLFQDLGARQIVVDFSGGTLSSDGGVLLLRQVDLSLGLTGALAECFGDERQQIFALNWGPLNWGQLPTLNWGQLPTFNN